MAEPSPEPTFAAGPSSRKDRSKSKLVRRQKTKPMQVSAQASMHKALLDSLVVGDKKHATFTFNSIKSNVLEKSNEFILKKGSNVEKLTITPESRITLTQSKKISNVIILELRFLDKSKSSLFNSIHLSFWPRKSLEVPGNPLNLSNKDFELFQRGSIHIVLEKVTGPFGKVYAKLRIDDSKREFYITPEDLASIGEFDDGENIQRFILLLVDIINSTASVFFPLIGAYPFRKTKKKRTKKIRRSKLRKKSKKRKTKKRKYK